MFLEKKKKKNPEWIRCIPAYTFQYISAQMPILLIQCLKRRFYWLMLSPNRKIHNKLFIKFLTDDYIPWPFLHIFKFPQLLWNFLTSHDASNSEIKKDGNIQKCILFLKIDNSFVYIYVIFSLLQLWKKYLSINIFLFLCSKFLVLSFLYALNDVSNKYFSNPNHWVTKQKRESIRSLIFSIWCKIFLNK